MYDSLEESVLSKKIPFMGICVGMQLLAEKAEEFGTHAGSGWIPGSVVRITKTEGYKIPHMCWNEVDFQDNPLFLGLEQKTNFYFVHSYYFKTTNSEDTAATTNYPNVITVASSNSSDVKATSSNYGNVVDVTAPGVSIVSTVPFNNYTSKSGTSMATPLVSGLIGLMISYNPNVPRDQILNC